MTKEISNSLILLCISSLGCMRSVCCPDTKLIRECCSYILVQPLDLPDDFRLPVIRDQKKSMLMLLVLLLFGMIDLYFIFFT